MHAPRVQSRVITPCSQMPHRCGRTKAKHTQSTLGAPGPIWFLPRAAKPWQRHRRRRKTSTLVHSVHALCVQSRVFTPWPERPRRCGPTKAKGTQSTLGSPGPFCTSEGRKNMTTTPETSQDINAGSLRACTACAKPSFYSLAPKGPVSAVQPRQNTRNPHLFLQGHLVLPRAAKT